jgi:hypothetical protein
LILFYYYVAKLTSASDGHGLSDSLNLLSSQETGMSSEANVNFAVLTK